MKMKKSKEILCPECGSSKVAEFLYGLPMFSPQLEKEIKSGKVILGGCCVSDNDPTHHCKNCGHEFKRSVAQ